MSEQKDMLGKALDDRNLLLEALRRLAVDHSDILGEDGSVWQASSDEAWEFARAAVAKVQKP